MKRSQSGRRSPRRARCAGVGFALLLAWPQAVLAQEPEDEVAASEAEGGDAAAEAAAEQEAQAQADAELAAEEAAATAALRKPPPKGKGGVWGTVTDTKFREAVIEAQVQVVGRKEKVLADTGGRFRLDLPPGQYRLRVLYELHQPARVDEVVVREGELTQIDVQLVPDEGAVEEVLIEDEVDTTSTEGQALTRKNSAVVGDGVGRAEIARTPDKNAAEAAQRVVGATIVGGRFVYVRGLGERYTNALLNGAPMPSPEPDRNTVPLDLFPSLVLDSLTIVKQFTPDMPGDFAGGSVRIETRDFPKQRLLQLSLSGGYNTEATFRKRSSDYSSSGEWLGYDAGRRQLPENIPAGKADSWTADERLRIARAMNTPMATLRKLTPPNHGITLVAGDSVKLSDSTKLGALAALTYSHGYQQRQLTNRRFYSASVGDSPTVVVADEFRGAQVIDSVRWGAFGSAALELRRNHTLSLTGLYSRSADNNVAELTGTFQNEPTTLTHTTHLEYVTRALSFGQLRGEHRFPRQRELEIDWHASLAAASRAQPDTRDVRYQQRENGEGVLGWQFSSDQSGYHQFLDQSDRTINVGVDVQQPLVQTKGREIKLKVGTLITSRDRDFGARRFQLKPDLLDVGPAFLEARFCPGAAWRYECPGYLFRPELIRPDGLTLEEWTLDLDRYETGLDVYGGYAQLDAQLLDKLRAVGGVRAEITYQIFTGYNPSQPEAPPIQSNIFQTDWLPALSLIYALTPKINLRAGGSKTLARPQLRELSPALFTSSAGDLNVQGNPNLQITDVYNADLRFEFFPTLREVLAASLFYKRFERPIEESIASNNTQGFSNAEQADLFGLELEGRQGLEPLAPVLKDFTVIGNLTLVRSEVEIGAGKGVATTDNRALSNQSPYIVNLQLDYGNDRLQTDFRLLYNVYGPRIVVVGAYSLPDIYELPRHQLDASASKRFGKHFELKLQAQNLLLAPVVLAYRQQSSYRADGPPGDDTVYTSLGRTPQIRRYQPGMSFQVSASYTY